MDKKVIFEVEGFSVLQEVSDEQFAIVQIYVCHDGNNKHNMPIKLSTLKKAAITLKNKYIVAGFDGEDFEGHEPDEMIVGHFPESTKISYKKKNGKTFLVADAMMSKVYAKWAYKKFTEQNHKGVSMEISVLEFGEEKDGLEEIKEFVFNGVTILGDEHTPACEGADASIIKFSVENASKYYGKYSWESNLLDLGVKTGKEGTEDMEDKDIIVEEVVTETPETIDTPVIETEEVVETNETIVEEPVAEPEVITEEEAPAEETEEVPAEETEFEKADAEEEESDKATMEDDEEEAEDKEDEEDTEDKKKEVNAEFASLTVEQKYEVFRAACRDKQLGYFVEFDDEYVYCYDYNEGYTYRYSYSLNGTEVALGDDKERVMRGGYVPFEETTEEGGEITPEADVTEDVANPEVEALQEEIAELKETIEAYQDEKKSTEVESILTSEGIVDVLSSEDKAELREEAKEFTLENLNEFANKVKARAFEASKGQTGKYSFARMPFATQEADTNSKYSW